MKSKFIHAIKANWKSMAFGVIYIFLCCISFALSINIAQLDGNIDFSLLISSFISILSLLGIIGNLALKAIFNEDAEKAVGNVYITVVPVILLAFIGTSFTTIFSIINNVSLAGGELGQILNLIAVIFIFAAAAMIVGLSFLLAFLAFLLLRLIIKHSKLLSFICVVSILFTICKIIYQITIGEEF